jgi:2'-5' RNA ligase
MIRLFIGLELPGEVSARLALMAGGIPGARWVEARNLHVTLRFLGEVEEGLAAELDEALAALSEPAFTLALDGFGTFGGRRRAHALWAGVERTPALVHLRDKVDSTAVRLGLPPEARKFMPHVTLAWVKASPIGRLQDHIAGNSPFHAGPWPVEHFTLFQSHLSRNGAEYEVLERYTLSSRGA